MCRGITVYTIGQLVITCAVRYQMCRGITVYTIGQLVITYAVRYQMCRGITDVPHYHARSRTSVTSTFAQRENIVVLALFGLNFQAFHLIDRGPMEVWMIPSVRQPRNTSPAIRCHTLEGRSRTSSGHQCYIYVQRLEPSERLVIKLSPPQN